MTGPRRYRDVRAATLAASPEAVWRAVLDQVEVLGLPSWYVRLIGCRDRQASGPRPLAADSVVYTLTFRVVPMDEGARLEAHSDATFPGFLGAVYRLLVIDSRFHKLATRSIVTRIRRRAEHPTQP
jgi:hypothetical protein